MLLGSSRSEQGENVSFITSGKPFPLLSAFERGSTTVKRLLAEAKVLELPVEFVATKTNVPGWESTCKLKTAETPERSVDAAVTLIAGELKDGAKANVDPVRLIPLTSRFGITLLKKADLQPMAVMTGEGRTVKLFVDVAVCPETVTEIGPVVAVAGTVTVRVVVDAESTGAVVPLNCTALFAGV